MQISCPSSKFPSRFGIHKCLLTKPILTVIATKWWFQTAGFLPCLPFGSWHAIVIKSPSCFPGIYVLVYLLIISTDSCICIFPMVYRSLMFLIISMLKFFQSSLQTGLCDHVIWPHCSWSTPLYVLA